MRYSTASNDRAAILTAIGDNIVRNEQIREATGLRHDRLNYLLAQLEKEGLVFRIGRGKWSINKHGN